MQMVGCFMIRSELNTNFIDNIERERIRLKLTQAQMAEKLGISVSGYKKMVLRETSRIDLYTAYLASCLTGKLISELYEDPNPDLKLIEKVRRLDKQQSRFVEDVVDFELDFVEDLAEGKDLGEDYIDVMVPTGNVDDGMIWDSVNLQRVNAAIYRKKFGDSLDCGILIASNHLHPVYHLGDILLICRREPRDGDTAVCVNKESGRAYIRKYYQTEPRRLEPINGLGHTFTIHTRDEEDMNKWLVFGYVLAKMRVHI